MKTDIDTFSNASTMTLLPIIKHFRMRAEAMTYSKFAKKTDVARQKTDIE